MEFFREVRDAFSQIRERAANPFLFSFIISWLISNWKLSVAIFWANTQDLKEIGFDNIWEFIQCYIDGDLIQVKTPVLIAAAYVLLNPFAKVITRAARTTATKLQDYLDIKITQGGSIPIAKYLDLRKDYKQQTKTLEKVLKEENVLVTEHRSQGVAINELNLKLNKAETDISKLSGELVRENNETKRLLSQINEFRILYAEYGRGDVYVDVTEALFNSLKTEKSTRVGNSLVNGNDPCINLFKRLKITYLYLGVSKTYTAFEYDTLVILHDSISSEQSEETKQNIESEAFWRLLNEIFQGVWELSYGRQDNPNPSKEIVIIDNAGRYFKNGKHAYSLLGIKIDVMAQKIKFTKRLADQASTYSTETLYYKKDEPITGNDSLENILTYKKLKVGKNN